MKRILFLTFPLLFSAYFAIGQAFTTNDYKKAAWMTLRFYGGQRSSQKSLAGPNWLVMDHAVTDDLSSKGFSSSAYKKGYDFTKDADGSTDLSGGWFDCGDHVKFGQTEFYAAYILLKGYSEWPTGYDDHYSYDYSGYRAAQDFTWEGAKGTPNGIPDVLDEVKYACEFFIKCTPNASTFYSQVGDGGADHTNWVTSVAMAALPKSQGGQSDGARVITKNPNDGSMPSFCAATLALMSRVYKQFDPDFAATCLEHAKYAYSYASGKKGATAAAGSFYPANARMYDDYVCACAELYWATDDATYKTEAIKYKAEVKDHNWQFGYNNNDDIAAYNLAKLGDADGLKLLEGFITNIYKGKADASGVYKSTDNWGTLRYNGNAAFIIALYNTYKKSTTVDKYIYSNIDYILGNNSGKLSYVVGFTSEKGGYSSALHPHHRNVYLTDNISAAQQNLTIPTRNKQFGFLCGSKGYDPATLKNAATQDYEITEGGIDYNAGLTGAIAYIVSMTSPVDPNKFGHPSPELGDDKTLCGVGTVTLTADVDFSNLETGEAVTYRWYKDAATTPFKTGATLSSIQVTEAGKYTCELYETSGNGWTTKDAVTVTATIGTVTLGKDVALCEATSATFDAGISGSGITYAWSKNGTTIAGATQKTYTAYTAGTYKVTVSATGCAAVSGSAIVTSSLPEVVGDTICAAGQVQLSVTTAGDYEWYNVATEGTALVSGSTYSPSITKSTTYYVQDAGSVSLTAGPSTTQFTGNGVNWGEIGAKFKTYSAVNITEMTIVVNSAYSTGSQTITMTLGGDKTGTFVSDAVNVSAAGAVKVTFNANPIVIPAAGSYTITGKWSNAALAFYESGPAYSSYQGNTSIIEFTGATNGTASSNPFPGLLNWKLSAGSTCARTPVLAVIDPNGNCGDAQAPTTPGTITVSNITTTTATATWTASTDNVGVTSYDVYVNGALYKTVTTNSIAMTGLVENTDYLIKVRATDAAGNNSAFNTESPFTTEKATETQTINLAAGWNLISFYVLPTDKSITNVLSSIASKVEIVKNDEGFYYTGIADELQSLTTFELGQGYLIKVSSAATLNVEGMLPTSTTVQLKAGWNLLGYPKATASSASTTLSGIWSNVSELKNMDGVQTTLTPGKGYYINMKSAGTVTFK